MYSNTLVHLERRFFVKQYGYCSRSVIPIWLAYLSVTSLLLSSVPRLFNRMSVYDKSACNKEDTLHIINFYTHKTCVCMRVPTLSCTVDL